MSILKEEATYGNFRRGDLGAHSENLGGQPEFALFRGVAR